MKLTDEAIEAAAKAVSLDWQNFLPSMRLALEAALPHLEGATPEWTDEERGFVETALAAADAGNAGHWPTVATYLAAEVRRLRSGGGATPTRYRLAWLSARRRARYASKAFFAEAAAARELEGATPAIDREALDGALADHEKVWEAEMGDKCSCGWRPDSWESEDEFDEYYRDHRTDVVLALIGGQS